MKLLAGFLFIAALLFNIANSYNPTHFNGSDELSWPDCASLEADVWNVKAGCESKPIVSKGGYLRVEFSSKNKVHLELAHLNKDLKNVGGWLPVRIRKAKTSNDWNLVEFQSAQAGRLVKLIAYSPVKIRTRIYYSTSKDKEENSFSVLNKLIAAAIFYNIESISMEKGYQILSAMFLLLFSIAISFYFLNGPQSGFFVLFIASLLMHFKRDAYFYFDHWTLLDVFQNQNILSYRHNEHYLPLFFGFLKLETLIFGANYYLYLILSNLIHAFNAIIVCKISEIIFSNNKKLSWIVSVLFLLSALHSESLHWAFEQSLLLCSTLMLLALFSALRYLESGKSKYLYFTYFTAALSPFVFGNGFIIILLLPLFCLLSGNALNYRNLLKLLLPIALCFICYSFFYFTKTPSPEVQLDYKYPRILAYLFTGTQFGIFLRSIGLYPDLELDSAAKLINFSKYPELIVSSIGLVLSTFLLGFSYLWRRDLFRAALLGFLVPFVIIILPALTRWHLGTIQSLSLRYSYLGVFAAFILLSPAISYLLELRNKKIITLFLALIIFSQLRLAKNFKYFSNYGVQHRIYIENLVDWKCSSAKASQVPIHEDSISPGFNQSKILEAYKFLAGDYCRP